MGMKGSLIKCTVGVTLGIEGFLHVALLFIVPSKIVGKITFSAY
jgi:hypothetical protein